MSVQEVGASPQKTLEAALFIAQRLDKPDLHEVLKIRYFADKLHFSKYGFPASGDHYVAMNFGPVASKTYDLLKVARGNASNFANHQYGAIVEGALRVEVVTHLVVALRAPNTDYLSQADQECLEEAIRENGGMDFSARTALSHDSAYDAAWAMAVQRHEKSYPMHLRSIAGALENADEVLAYLAA